MTVIGLDGLPEPKNAGNVLNPFLEVKISLRLPPTLDAIQAEKDLKKLFENNPPYECEVSFRNGCVGDGCLAPPFSQGLKKALNDASKVRFIKSKKIIWLRRFMEKSLKVRERVGPFLL